MKWRVRGVRRRMPRAVLQCLVLLVLAHVARTDDHSRIALPRSGDRYAAFVRQLEAGQTDINYTEFRESFLESHQSRSAGTRTPDINALRDQMRELIMQGKTAKVRAMAERMLSIDYTDMEAHKALRQSYKLLGDTPNSKKYHDIEFGLLYSIIRNGDGHTCGTAWPVIQVSEEYFILRMLGATLARQSIDTTGGLCDRMEVHTDQGDRVYYFEISRVFKGYDIQGKE
jgi:hypothetical protein